MNGPSPWSPNGDLILVVPPKCEVAAPPLGPAGLVAYLRRQGFTVGLADLNLRAWQAATARAREAWDGKRQGEWSHREFADQWVREAAGLVDEWVATLRRARPRAVGFSCWHTTFHVAAALATKIRSVLPETRIIFGGPDVALKLQRGELREPRLACVDAFVLGEGEATIAELLARFRAGDPVAGCAGTAWRRDGDLVVEPARPPLTAPGSLPPPDFSDFDLAGYADQGRVLPAQFSRGCLNRCIYCDEREYWGSYRNKSAAEFGAETRELKARHPQLLHLYLTDSLINGNLAELRRWCELMRDSGAGLTWEVNAVLRQEMTPELLGLMHAGGCRTIIYGLETAASGLWPALGKVLAVGCDPDRIVQATAAAGIEAWVNFMFGVPGETAADAETTLAWVKRNAGSISMVIPSFACCVLNPTAAAARQPERYGLLPVTDPTHWESSDGTNTFPVRLARFERFCREVNAAGIRSTYPHDQALDRDRQLAGYHLSRGDREQAAACLARARGAAAPAGPE